MKVGTMFIFSVIMYSVPSTIVWHTKGTEKYLSSENSKSDILVCNTCQVLEIQNKTILGLYSLASIFLTSFLVIKR